MNLTGQGWRVKATSDSLARQALILAGVMLVAAIPLGTIGFLTGGRPGLTCAAIAGVVCLASGVAALWLAGGFGEPQAVSAQVLAGMLPRMGIPLAVCMVVYFQGGMLVESGFVYYILIFYFVTLATDTVLLLGKPG